MTDAEFTDIMTCVDPKCWCETCRPHSVEMRMILCPDCGNKRCPKATDHRNACTGSNEPGQKGSSYEHCSKPAETTTAHIARARVLAIDPGTIESGWCVLGDDQRVYASGVMPNAQLLLQLPHQHLLASNLAIEMIASYGMAVGREVFETCVWIGRFVQAWHKPEAVRLVYRRDVKLHLCGSPRAKDQNIRQALIDLIGPQGTKKAPGPTYGVKSHAWAALGVAVTAASQMMEAA